MPASSPVEFLPAGSYDGHPRHWNARLPDQRRPIGISAGHRPVDQSKIPAAGSGGHCLSVCEKCLGIHGHENVAVTPVPIECQVLHPSEWQQEPARVKAGQSLRCIGPFDAATNATPLLRLVGPNLCRLKQNLAPMRGHLRHQ